MAAGSIADELILLALYPDNDGWPVGADGTAREPWYLQAAVSVAVLADLAVSGAISVGGGRVSNTGRGVDSDEELGELATRIAKRPGLTPEYWALEIYADEPQRRRLALLRQRHLILEYEREARRLWRSKTVRRWFVREDDALTALTVRRLGDVLHTGKADESTTTLLAIVGACGLHRKYFKDLDRGEREQRIRHLVSGHWAWQTTKRCLSSPPPILT